MTRQPSGAFAHSYQPIYMAEYLSIEQRQAENFLAETETIMKVLFLEHNKHFPDDVAMRDIFKVTFTRGRRSFFVRFGQSLKDSNKKGTHKPTAYDVLCCLQKNEVGTFEDFCSEYGYDTDSKRAEKIYYAVGKEYANLQRIWTDAEIDKLQEIQ